MVLVVWGQCSECDVRFLLAARRNMILFRSRYTNLFVKIIIPLLPFLLQVTEIPVT
jgi:hypothetical protein